MVRLELTYAPILNIHATCFFNNQTAYLKLLYFTATKVLRLLITFYLFVLFLVAKQVELQLYVHIYTICYHIVNKQGEAVEKTT